MAIRTSTIEVGVQMQRSRTALAWWLAVWCAIPLGVFFYLNGSSEKSVVWDWPTFHFYVVSTATFVATVCSAVIGWVGARLRNTNVLLLALAFTSLSGFLLIHGLATPGFILHGPMSHIPSVATQMGMTTCAVWVMLSTLSSDRKLIRIISKNSRSFVLAWVILLTAMAVVGLLRPDAASVIPADDTTLKIAFALITCLLFLWSANRYYQQYRFARFPVQLSIVFGVVWLCIAEVIIVSTKMWTPAWWSYHVLCVVAMGMVLYGVLRQYFSRGSLTETFQTMFSSVLTDRIRAGLSPRVGALIRATEAKDPYTAGHNLRVAVYALQLADELKLLPEQKRALAQGGVIHDVGKIEVPEAVLNKPGSLTPEERKVIELHPVTGYNLCKRMGFMKDELDIVRSHHERWDGRGYPDGLAGEDIPFLARVLAVVDVYDALTTERAYRQPWTHERALDLIREQAGTQFDPAVVQAWSHLCGTGLATPDISVYEVRLAAQS